MERRSRRSLLVLLGGGVLALLWRPGARDYEVQDVTRYAQMVVEMQHDGTIVPTLERRPYHEAMPLAAWIPLAVARCAGAVTPATSRLVPGLATVGTLLLTLALGAGASPGVGLLAASMLLFTPLVLQLGHESRVDALLAAALAATLVAFFHAREQRGLRQASWMALSGVSLALAFAAKGPYALVLAGAVVLTSCILERRAALAAAWCLGAGSVALLLTAAWLLPYSRVLGPHGLHDFFDQMVLRETVAKFQEGYGKERPVWYYVPVLCTQLAPWSLVAVVGGLRGVRRWRCQTPLWRFCAVWCVVPLVLLSVSRGKHSRYLLPMVPPLTILAALEVTSWIRSASRRLQGCTQVGLRVAAGVVAAALLGLGVLVARSTSGSHAGVVVAALCTLLALAPLVRHGVPRRRGGAQCLYLAAAGLVGVFYGDAMTIPRLAPPSLPACLAAALREQIPANETVALLGGTDVAASQLALHLGRWVEPLERGQADVWQGLLIADRRIPGQDVVASVPVPTQEGEQHWFLLQRPCAPVHGP